MVDVGAGGASVIGFWWRDGAADLILDVGQIESRGEVVVGRIRMLGKVSIEVSLEVPTPQILYECLVLGQGEGIDQNCTLLLQRAESLICDGFDLGVRCGSVDILAEDTDARTAQSMTVYQSLIKHNNPKNMAVFGTSAGGALVLEMMLRAKQAGLPMPGAIAPGTPMADVTKTGDSFYTNDMVDNVLVSRDGFCHAATLVYAHGHDLRDPMLSPVYGDMHGFPPAILTTGTRDLLLSNTVRVHRKLREAGVEAQLEVFEGESHAQYQLDDRVPETREAFGEITAFFDKHLGH